MEGSESPRPGRPTAPVLLVAAAAAAFLCLAAAGWAVCLAGGFEPAAAVVVASAALCLAVVLAVLRLLLRPAAGVLRMDGGALALLGFGAALGAGIFAATAALAPGLDGPLPAVATANGASDARWCGRTMTYPDAATARGDALVACGQARSLARVLLIGGGRPELVRELLGRGAAEVDVVEPDAVLEAVLEPLLSEEDRVALASPRVRRHRADPLAFLRGFRGPPYDLAVVSPPEPRGIRAGRWYAVEFHRELAGRLAPMGVVVVSLPETMAPRAELPLARAFASMQSAYPRKAVAALPGPRCRLVASRLQGVLVLEAAAAAERCSARLLPGGGTAPTVSPTEMQPLLAARQGRELTGMLDDLALHETLRAPRLYLEHAAVGGCWAGLPGIALRTPLWTCLPVLVLVLFAGMFLAGRSSTAAGPGRFALGAAAFATGAVCVGAMSMLALLFQSLQGALCGRLALFSALAAAAFGLGGAAAGRLAGRMRLFPRKSLTIVGFAWLLLLLLSVAVANLTPAGPAAGTLIGLAIVLLGFSGGLELGALGTLLPAGAGPEEQAGAAWPALLPAMALLGAAGGALLVASGLLPAFGAGVSLLLLLGAKLVELGIIAAGAGRGRGG